MTKTALACAGLLALLASACSDGSESTSTAASTPASESQVTPSDPPATDAAEVAAAPADTAPPTTAQPETADATTSTNPSPTTEPLVPESYDGYRSAVYAKKRNWLCRPGIEDDVCARDLDATSVRADGSTAVFPHERAEDPVADCFYVYPTVSRDPEANSDLVAAEGEEIHTTVNQFARMTAQCRTFAPIYPQRTLTALSGAVETRPKTASVAYDGALDAFRHFIANDNDGRPFVLIGHSQGAYILREILREEIDDEPALRERMLSAMLLGASVSPSAYDNIPACATRESINCLITYSSYRDTAPPPEDGIFGITDDGPAVCVNPVDPAGGVASSLPYFQVRSEGLLGGSTEPYEDPERSAEITTPFVLLPDMITVACVEQDGFGYLELRTATDDGPRIDDIGGDLSPEWGMHLVDVNVAMGDLVELVATQSATWDADRP